MKRRRQQLIDQARRSYLKEGQLKRCRNPQLASVVERNIEAIEQHRKDAESAKNFEECVADYISWFSGSMPFIYFHVIFFTAWIAINTVSTGITQFDPYPFGMLTTIVSLEAIFLSTFVLLSQNRQALVDERRSELDLQINLLSEYEVTRILMLTDEIAKKLGIRLCDPSELKDLENDVDPETLLKALEDRAIAPAVAQNEKTSTK